MANKYILKDKKQKTSSGKKKSADSGNTYGGMLGKAEGALKSRTSRIDAAIEAATGGGSRKKPSAKSKY